MANQIDDLLAIRQGQHGDFAQTAKLAQDLKATIRSTSLVVGYSLNDQQAESLDMICTKIARIVCGDRDEPDHWRDIGGYARLVERALEQAGE